MSRVSRRVAAVLVLSAVALAASCGGGDDSDSSADSDATALEADELREQADAICAQANERLDAVGEPTSADEIAPALSESLAISSDQLEQLQGLEPPDELAADYQRALDLLDERQGVINEMVAEIEAGDADPVAALQAAPERIEEIRSELNELADEIGLTVCGAGSDG